jgi:flavin-dependent dehydrogenase
MSEQRPLHVAVIGASLAGLFAAAAASSAGCRVTLIERDVLPTEPRARRGVPQSEQSHILLFRGVLAAEQLLPGLRRQLSEHGAPQFPGGRLPLLGAEGWAPLGDYGFDMLCVSRTLLEHVVRERVLAMDTVHLRSGVRVHGLHPHHTAWRVQLQEHHADAAGGQTPGSLDPGRHPQEAAGDDRLQDAARPAAEDVAADIVIDASGRSSRLPRWLQELGVTPAKTTTVDAQVGYATRRYTSPRPPGPGVIMMASPRRSRGCMVGPIENGQWLVSTVGIGEHRPGRDEVGFAEHLQQLPYPTAAEMVQEMTPVSEIAVHRQTANVRHRYEDVRNWPDGLLVTGDALCAVNPMYGQGITVAACQGLLLHEALAAAAAQGRLRTRKVQKRLARVANLPWTMATSQDRQFLNGPERARLQEAFVSGWGTEIARLAMHGDQCAADAMQAVTHLMAPPAALFTPSLLLAVARARLTSLLRPVPSSAVEPA